MADPGVNPSAPSYLDITDPYGAIQAAQIQRQQAIAAALLNQGMAMPGELGQTHMAGNVAIRNSPLQGLAGLAQTLAGTQGLMSSATQAGQLQGQRLTQAAQAYAPQTAPPGGPQAGAGPFQGMTPTQMLALEIRNPGKLEEMQSAWNMQQNKPTEATLTATQAGMPPEIVQAANARALDKSLSNFKEDREGRMWDLTKGTLVGVAPNLAPGSTYGPIGPNGFPTGAQTFPGGPQSYQDAAFAQSSGAAGGNIGQYTVNGREGVPMSGMQVMGGLPRIPTIMGGQPAASGPPGAPAAPMAPGQTPAPMPQATPTASPTRPPAAPAAPPGALPPAQGPGVQGFGKPLGIDAQIGNVQKMWTDQQAANANAQTTISYLQTIKDLANKAATGAFSDKLFLANSLLAKIPGAGQAQDTVTATNLLNKYSNQITSLLGSSGGMSTDAGKQILQAAYPNVHMDPAAISDAADTLIGAQHQVQARTGLLQPYGQKNDPNYSVAQTKFDQIADPRIFVWKNMPAGAARDAYAAKIIKADPTIPARAAQLEKMGVQ